MKYQIVLPSNDSHTSNDATKIIPVSLASSHMTQLANHAMKQLTYTNSKQQTETASLHTLYDIEFFSRSVRQTTYLGSRLAVDDLPFSRLAVDDLPGSRLVNAESRRLPGSPDDFLEVQTTSWKSRRLPGSPDDFLEVQTTSWKSRRLPGSPDDFVRRLPRSPDDFQTTSRRLTGKSSRSLPDLKNLHIKSRSEKPAYPKTFK
ncbi:hypothetical protein YC2023_023315 [Brassica napus]